MIIIIIIITLIKQIDKMQSYYKSHSKHELINVFKKHSVYVVSVVSLNS